MQESFHPPLPSRPLPLPVPLHLLSLPLLTPPLPHPLYQHVSFFAVSNSSSEPTVVIFFFLFASAAVAFSAALAAAAMAPLLGVVFTVALALLRMVTPSRDSWRPRSEQNVLIFLILELQWNEDINQYFSFKSVSLPHHAMTSTAYTLLLLAVAFMASGSSAAPARAAASAGAGLAGGVTCFICVKCTETRQLSSHWLFLNCASVRRHIVRSKPCMDAHLGYREILVQARAGDVMAGGGGTAGLAPSIRYQAPGAQTRRVTATMYTHTN